MHSTLILVAVGPSGERQEFSLNDHSYAVGRADGRHDPRRLAISGDPLLSRHHFDLDFENGSFTVVRNPAAKNPIFFMGKESDRFELAPGQTFLSGKTRFQLAFRGTVGDTPPTTEFTLLRTDYQPAKRQNIAECFRALVELLPELRNSAEEETAFNSAVGVLKSLLPDAAEFMVFKVSREGELETQLVASATKPGRSGTTPPSRGLLSRAFESNGTIAHVWAAGQAEPSAMTEHARADWAVASPVEVAGSECYALYVVGSAPAALSPTEAERQKRYLDDMTALVDIVAETLSHHLAVARLNRFEGQVTRFFSPVLRQSLAGREFSEVLRPTRRVVTVLFFDLRGFSRATEEAEEDLEQILGHHEVLTDVMTAVTDCVFSQDGVVVDYQGDAVMACWGALADGSEAHKAVAAARNIVERIYSMDLPFTSGPRALRCGLGLASGEAIAGQIGAREQIKFGVLGRVVNLASRLEGLTKYFGVPILMSDGVRQNLVDNECLCRRIGMVRPAGVAEATEVHELVVGSEFGGSGLSLDEVRSFEEAALLFSRGDMNAAYEALLEGSRANDPVGRFLTRSTLQYLDDGVPKGWDGVLRFDRK
ncbi:MAG: adenylate/guanylate cyclase domain-containing protein [Vulcanimicrobiota bacterium]